MARRAAFTRLRRPDAKERLTASLRTHSRDRLKAELRAHGLGRVVAEIRMAVTRENGGLTMATTGGDSMRCVIVFWLMIAGGAAAGAPLAGTEALEGDGDLAMQMVEGIGRFL